MERACFVNGKLQEHQSGGWYHPAAEKLPEEEKQSFLKDYQDNCLDTLKQNALDAGYKEGEIEVKWVTDEEWSEIQEANKPIPTYAELRARAYPDYREYLDGIVKGDQEQIDKYINDCLAVKEKYPKE